MREHVLEQAAPFRFAILSFPSVAGIAYPGGGLLLVIPRARVRLVRHAPVEQDAMPAARAPGVRERREGLVTHPACVGRDERDRSARRALLGGTLRQLGFAGGSRFGVGVAQRLELRAG